MSTLHTTLNDKVVDRLAPAKKGQYIVRDSRLAGFFVVVGTRKKTFTVQGEVRQNGQRKSRRLALGSTEVLTTREARVAAKAALARIAQGDGGGKQRPGPAPQSDNDTERTLGEAWARYRTAHLQRKGRSEGTIAGYGDHVERLLKDWMHVTLKSLAEDPGRVARRHDELTASSGPYAANGCMRTLRAIYNHARRTLRGLPPDNPVMAVDWNPEHRRDAAMGLKDVSTWMMQARRLRNPIRREFHLFTLLSGSRPTALKTARVSDFNFSTRVLHIARPKGGADRAFDIPLSRPMIRCLVRAIRVSRMLHAEAAEDYIFAASSTSGHLVEHKEDREVGLAKWGNDLRHTYRTLGQAAGLSGVDMHLLMNHRVKGANVNEGYISRSKLLNDHLRSAQQRLSDFIFDAGLDRARKQVIWPLLPSRRLGDAEFVPAPPNPRLGVKTYSKAA